MKLSRKLVMVSAAALMGISPLAAPVVNSSVAQAATKKASSSKVHNTYGKSSKVKPTKTQYAVNENGKKTSKKVYKNGNYTIWNVKEIDGEVYFSIQTDLKYWIPAVDTKGSVEYKSGSTTVTIKTDGKKVVQTEETVKSTKKKASKKTAKKTSSKKETSKKSDKKSEKKSTKKTTKKESSKKETSKKSTKKETAKKDSKKTVAKKADKKVTEKSEKTTAKKETSKKTAKSDKKSTKAAKSTKKEATKKDSKTATKKSDKKSEKKSSKKAIKPVKITATKKTPVVDKNGKKVKTYMGSKKYTIIGKGVTVNGLGTKKIDGKTYYALQPNHYYVLASNFKTVK